MKKNIGRILSIVVGLSLAAMMIVAVLPHTHLHNGQGPLSETRGDDSCFLCHVQASFSLDHPLQNFNPVQQSLLKEVVILPADSPRGIVLSYLPSQRAPPFSR